MNNYLTTSFPGTGGSLKESPEDFLVEELPLYTPCGEGEHLYLTVEKRDLTTFDLLQQLARALGVPEREIGYAGLKDARATTRQTVSIAGVRPEQAMALELAGVRILAARYHRNKLRLGHLAGNRFEIRLREVRDGALETALDVLQVLEQVGVPNLFGQPRSGSLGNSHLIGAALLRRDFSGAAREIIGDPAKIGNERGRLGAAAFAAGDLAGALAALPSRMRDERRMLETLRAGRSAEEAVMGLPRKLLRLYLSAFQSAHYGPAGRPCHRSAERLVAEGCRPLPRAAVPLRSQHHAAPRGSVLRRCHRDVGAAARPHAIQSDWARTLPPRRT
jgi:tRNA pseudouridine13 synthase